jgi:hypothetical protein
MIDAGKGRSRLVLAALVAALLVLAPVPSLADEPQAASNISQEVDGLIAALDDADFATRRDAAERLEKLTQREELAGYLAVRFRTALASPEVSFEARSHLEPLVRLLPAAPDAVSKPSASAIGPLVEQLKSDSYAKRDSAARQLRAMLEHAELIVPVWTELKKFAADPALSTSGRRALRPLLDRAHEAWLLADPKQVPLPKPAPDEIKRLIEVFIAEQAAQSPEVYERTPAERELLDLIARDDTQAEVLEQLHQRLAEQAEGPGSAALQHLIDFSRPGMAAEAWSNQHHTTLQYLLIGVPQYNETLTTPRATHFDRIDDHSAHCVSGNSLTEGEYPVRVAIPHPEPGRETLFVLTNLPTPRRRLAFEYAVERDERLRLRELTERTLTYFLERKTPLSEVEVLMLAQLEPHAVSRFVGDYFQKVPNAPLNATAGGLNTQQTVYAGMCAVLARTGTREALPALEKLARSGALGKPTYPNRVEIGWVAALAIAQREERDEIDVWLASLIDETVKLTTDPDMPPDLGASAAGLLLDRHGVAVRPFGLWTSGESVTEAYAFVGYRFSTAEDRENVKRWWQKQKELLTAARSKPQAEEPESKPKLVPRIAPAGANGNGAK